MPKTASTIFRTVTLPAAALLVFVLLRLSPAGRRCDLDLSLVQIIVFPLAAAALARFEIARRQFPRLCLWLACAGALAASAWAYLYFLHPGKYVLVARYSDDCRADRTSALLRSINGFLREVGAVRAVRYFRPLRAAAEAEPLLASAGGVVLPSDRWLQLVLPASKPQSLADLASDPETLKWLGQAGQLRLITETPSFGLSTFPGLASPEFVALLFSVLAGPNGDFAKPENQLTPDGEINLRAAAAMISLWSSNQHRVAAWFLLGNWYLKSALADRPRPERVSCALDAYEHSVSVFRPRDYAELAVALKNNTAVALLTRALLLHGTVPRKSPAFRLLKKLHRFRSSPSGVEVPPETWQAIAVNQRIARALRPKPGNQSAEEKRGAGRVRARKHRHEKMRVP